MPLYRCGRQNQYCVYQWMKSGMYFCKSSGSDVINIVSLFYTNLLYYMRWQIHWKFEGLSVDIRKRQNKEPRQICYTHYLTWALALWKRDVGPIIDGKEPKYSSPREVRVLAVLRSLVPEDIKGELLDDAYQVTLEEFCKGLDVPNI